MPGKVAAKTLEAELSLAVTLLKNNWELEFPRPAIMAGDIYRDEFFDIRTKEDYELSLQVLMVYQDAGNRIFVPDRMLYLYGKPDPGESSAQRIFSFLHECTHAYHANINPALHSAKLRPLAESKFRMIREKGYVYEVFSEGAATYIAARTIINSGYDALMEYGKRYHKDITGSWNKWCTRYLALLADRYGLDISDPLAILYRYLWRESGQALLAHRYHLGYAFMSGITPEPELFRNMSADPPSIIEHLVYPATYLKGLKIETLV